MSSAAAKAAGKISSPPSSFAVLLRRSKFATYDPKIGQVYATYGGSVNRGDWGLKRPLAIRRKDTRITINNFDTIYQQTEWENASTDAMLVRKYEELKLTPNLSPKGSWAPRIGHMNPLRIPNYIHDADYVDSPEGKREAMLRAKQPMPDPAAMSEKRFERYVRKVRRLGEEFESYFDEREAERALKRIGPGKKKGKKMNMYTAAKEEHIDYARFIAEKEARIYDEKDATALRPFPHPTAGLSYALTSDLQRGIDADPVPGRALHAQASYRKNPSAKDVAIAGWVATAPCQAAPDIVDWGTDDEPRTNKLLGIGKYKPVGLELLHAPNVVGERPERIEDQDWMMRVIDYSEENALRWNPHRHGTAEGIAFQEKLRAKRAEGASGNNHYNVGRSSFLGKATRRRQYQSEDKGPANELISDLHTMLKDVDSKDGISDSQ